MLTALRLYYAAIFAALGIYLPFFPRWLEARGLEGLRMGLIVALVPALSLIAPPVLGRLSDALGLRGVLLRIAAAAGCLGFGAIAAASAFGATPGFGALLALAAAFALCRSAMFVMADVVTLEHASRSGYARIRLWGSLGFLLAALGAGRWLDIESATALPAAIAAALAAAFVLSLGLPARTVVPAVPSAEGTRALLARPAFRLFLATYLVSQLAHSAYDLCFSLHLLSMGASSAFVGLAWALGVLAEVVLMARSAPLLERRSAPALAAFAILAAALRWVLIASVGSQPVLLAAQPLHALSFGLLWIASVTYVRDVAPPGTLATAQGLFAAAAAAGNVVGLLLWSALYREAGGAVTFAAAALVALAALWLAVIWRRRAGATSRRDRAPRSASRWPCCSRPAPES
jgi:MFS transporter, PPP family, 3-phenylpropionic acid transporter